MSFTTDPDKAVPHLEVNADTGTFVYAVAQMPPGKHYMAEGTSCTWSEYMRLWSEITGIKAAYKQVTIDQLVDIVPDDAFAKEFGDMLTYCSDPGYDGGMELVTAKDMRQVSVYDRISVRNLSHS